MSTNQQNFITPLTSTGNSNYDPYYSNVTLLLPMNGVNGSTSFPDASLDTKTVAVSGNTQISTTQSKFGGSSAYFDGTTDFLSISASNAFDIFPSDFTVEFFVYFSGSVNNQCLFQIGANNTNRANVSIASNLILVFSTVGGVGGTQISATAPATNTWHHVAWVKSSTTTTLYVNGTSVGTPVTGISYPSGSMSLSIGADQINSGVNCLLGYIDDLRVTAGIARYATNFTAPVYANPLTGTMYDSFYNNVSLLLHCNGVNGSTNFIDNSSSPKTVTANGNARLSSTQWKFNRSSAYFDGTGDWLSTPNSTDLNLVGVDFTIEAWIYYTQLNTGNMQIVNKDGNASFYPSYSMSISSTGKLNGLVANSTGTSVINLLTSTATVTANTWNHVAFTRSGSTLRIFINGTIDQTFTQNITMVDSGRALGIGWQTGYVNGDTFYGYIDDLRITKGVARYTSNFTPPKLPFPDTGIQIDPYYDQTGLLLSMNGANASTSFIDSSRTAKSITVNGNTQLSTAQSKFGGSSALFDGTTDWLYAPTSTDLDFGTGNFTVEGWFYWNSLSNGGLFHIFPGTPVSSVNGGATGFDGTQFQIYVQGAGYGQGGSVSVGTWYHVAYVRLSGSVSLYVNGTKQGVSRSDNTNYGGNGINIGLYYSSSYTFPGYIDDFRVTKGIARYTSNFTVPVQPNPTTGILYDNYYNNVSLLLSMNGSNSGTSFIDGSPRAKAVTANGNAITSTTQYKYGISSAYFDGTGDYLTLTTGEEFNFGTGDFTIECWVYVTNYTTERPILYKYITWATNVDFALRIDSSTGIVRFIGGDSGLISIVSNSAISTNQWVHIAVTRSSGTTKMFINGITQTSTSTGNHLIPNDATTLYIGTDGSALSVYYLGYMDDLRITKGIARYTANFTPPTQAVPNQGPATDPYYSNTVLLLHCNGTNASTNFVDNSPVIKSVATTGNAQISTAQSKFGGSSAYFDGTGDTLTCTSSDLILTANFTVELWIYPNSVVYGEFYRLGSESSGRYIFFVDTGNIKTNLFGSGSQPIYGTLSTGVWTHLALVRSGTTIRVYINGVVSGVTDTQSGTLGNTGLTTIGNALNGYTNDLRITKGVARYINNFTPPQQSFPNFGPLPSAYPQIL